MLCGQRRRLLQADHAGRIQPAFIGDPHPQDPGALQVLFPRPGKGTGNRLPGLSLQPTLQGRLGDEQVRLIPAGQQARRRLPVADCLIGLAKLGVEVADPLQEEPGRLISE